MAPSTQNLDTPSLTEAYSKFQPQYQNVSGLKLLEHLNIHAGQTIVDLGCGTGELTRHVATPVGPSGRVIGIDPSTDRIENARRLASAIDQPHDSATVQHVVGTAEDLPHLLSANTVDMVYLNSAFHWIEDKASALRSIFAVLKPATGILGICGGSTDRWQI